MVVYYQVITTGCGQFLMIMIFMVNQIQILIDTLLLSPPSHYGPWREAQDTTVAPSRAIPLSSQLSKYQLPRTKFASSFTSLLAPAEVVIRSKLSTNITWLLIRIILHISHYTADVEDDAYYLQCNVILIMFLQ